ncbi:glycosyl transferase family protein, partial [mine drainage metagenome]
MNPETPPRISVCIANYNGEGVLGDCLDSVLAQTVDTPAEIIVHDDASTDASLQLLRERYPQVALIASNANVGFCVANNRMVAQAQGEFVLLLNNDAALAPDALATLLREAGQQQPRGILALPQYDWASGALVDRGCLLDPFYNPVPNTDPQR